jgi:hypothetical protein
MPTPDLVTGDDLDIADRDAAASPDAVIERIMNAVADPALRGEGFNVGEAMVRVSELQLTFGRPADAEATLRAAVAAGEHGEYLDTRAWLAALLVDLHRPDDAAREFAQLKKLGRAGADEHLIYGEAVEASGDFTAAINVFAAGELAAERAGDTTTARMLHRAADRARNGGVPSVPRYAVPALAADDLLDDLPDDLLEGDDAGPEVAADLFWPRPDHERVVAAWPDLAAEVGADWDEHRTLIERDLARAAELGAVPLLVVSSFVSFEPHAGAHPTVATLDSYLRKNADELDIAAWPPERNAPCWCGSGQKYKRCCRPRGFAS